MVQGNTNASGRGRLERGILKSNDIDLPSYLLAYLKRQYCTSTLLKVLGFSLRTGEWEPGTRVKVTYR